MKNKNLFKNKLHLIQLDREILHSLAYLDDKPHVLYSNIKNHRFEGYLINTSSVALYFEPKDHEGLIIVPHAWVKWCVPIEEKEE